MTSSLRKFVLTAHITSSVGWLGAVAGFFALAIAGLVSTDAQIVRAAYLAMNLIGWFVIVPLSLTSLLIGLIQALGTPWGLFRHHWVLMKFVITVIATFLLLLHMQPTSHLAVAARQTELSSIDLHGPRVELVVKSGAALIALLAATALSVYKPKGVTEYGRRKLREQGVEPDAGATTNTPRLMYTFGVLALALFALLEHLTRGGHHGH